MVIPVLAVFTQGMNGFSPVTVGLAIGGYGFSQALLQIPMGWLSDKIGRKSVISAGLLIFMVGSVIAALSDSMNGIIMGRIIQGCGAISAAIIALAADLTREQHRTKGMAIIGMGIGLSFCLAMIMGPVIGSYGGLSGLFLANAAMGGIALMALIFFVPSPVVFSRDLNSHVQVGKIRDILRNPNLLRYMGGIFTLHFVLMALFVFIPKQLQQAGYDSAFQGVVYLGVMMASLVVMMPMIIISERRRWLKQFMLVSIAVLLLSLALLSEVKISNGGLIVAIILFFIAFNFLEATLPSLVSKQSKAGFRGTAMGIYTTCQFLGAALGGSLGGWIMMFYGIQGVVFLCGILVALWWLYSATMKHPPYVRSMVMALYPSSRGNTQETGQMLAALPGVEDVSILADEGIAYLKVDWQRVDRSMLYRYGKC